MNEAPLGFLFTFLCILIALSGFFSSSETGMMSLNRYRLKHLLKSGHPGARRASTLLERPDRLIGLILIGNNLVNILASAIATIIAIRLWGDAGIAIATLLLTLVILIFAEITPKTIAALHPERVAFPASLILLPLLRTFYPIVWFINIITNSLLRLLGVDPDSESIDHLSTEELRTIVGEAGPHIPHRHRRMLTNILDLEKATVNDILIPRNDVFGIDLEEDDSVIYEKLQTCEYTRIPVFRKDINTIAGILHMRNAGRIMKDNGIDRDMLNHYLREPYFVPEGTPLHTQMFNFQKQKRRIGLVVDEYGEIEGIVTLEDILEEIVGEFTSNFTDVVDEIYPQADGTFIVNGTATLREVNRALSWDFSTEGPKTLNGLILEHLESFPEANVGLMINNCYIETLAIKDNFIETARLEVLPKESSD